MLTVAAKPSVVQENAVSLSDLRLLLKETSIDSEASLRLLCRFLGLEQPDTAKSADTMRECLLTLGIEDDAEQLARYGVSSVQDLVSRGYLQSLLSTALLGEREVADFNAIREELRHMKLGLPKLSYLWEIQSDDLAQTITPESVFESIRKTEYVQTLDDRQRCTLKEAIRQAFERIRQKENERLLFLTDYINFRRACAPLQATLRRLFSPVNATDSLLGWTTERYLAAAMYVLGYFIDEDWGSYLAPVKKQLHQYAKEAGLNGIVPTASITWKKEALDSLPSELFRQLLHSSSAQLVQDLLQLHLTDEQREELLRSLLLTPYQRTSNPFADRLNHVRIGYNGWLCKRGDAAVEGDYRYKHLFDDRPLFGSRGNALTGAERYDLVGELYPSLALDDVLTLSKRSNSLDIKVLLDQRRMLPLLLGEAGNSEFLRTALNFDRDGGTLRVQAICLALACSAAVQTQFVNAGDGDDKLSLPEQLLTSFGVRGYNLKSADECFVAYAVLRNREGSLSGAEVYPYSRYLLALYRAYLPFATEHSAASTGGTNFRRSIFYAQGSSRRGGGSTKLLSPMQLLETMAQQQLPVEDVERRWSGAQPAMFRFAASETGKLARQVARQTFGRSADDSEHIAAKLLEQLCVECSSAEKEKRQQAEEKADVLLNSALPFAGTKLLRSVEKIALEQAEEQLEEKMQQLSEKLQAGLSAHERSYARTVAAVYAGFRSACGDTVFLNQLIVELCGDFYPHPAGCLVDEKKRYLFGALNAARTAGFTREQFIRMAVFEQTLKQKAWLEKKKSGFTDEQSESVPKELVQQSLKEVNTLLLQCRFAPLDEAADPVLYAQMYWHLETNLASEEAASQPF